MLLAIDVGNSNISYGILDGTELVHHLRSESARLRTSDEYAVLIREMMKIYGVDPGQIREAIIASVVPTLTDVMATFVQRAFGVTPLVVGPGIKSGMSILYEDPRAVGADRVVNAVAAYEWARGAVIVVDFGTATTFDCVSPRGEYMGGVITPGVQISAEALFSRAARLSRVELAVPPKVIGKNPTTSMQSGLVYGYASLVDGLCVKLKKEIAEPCRVVATGGLARLIGPETEAIERIDDDLTLQGLRIIYERNRP